VKDLQWWNQSHPQTLQIGVALSYLNGVFGIIGLGTGAGMFTGVLWVLGLPAFLIVILNVAGLVGAIIAGLLTASDRKWGYWLAVGIAAAVVLSAVVFLFTLGPAVIISLIFDVAWLVALLHPMSRDYQRIYFR